MTDLSDKEKDRLRQLEEEVEKERVREKKAREEAEAKARALMKVEEEGEDPEQAKKKAVVKTSRKELQLARESRIKLRNQILVGGGGLLAMLLLWSNIIQLIGIGAFLGGGYFALNKYLVGDEIRDDDEEGGDSGGKGPKSS